MGEGFAPESVKNILAKSTCLLKENGTSRGTAWLLSNSGYLLTAAHLLNNKDAQGKKTRYSVSFLDGIESNVEIVFHEYEPGKGLDFAVLRMDSINANLRPLPIDFSQDCSGSFSACGFGKTLQSLSLGSGKILGRWYPNGNSSDFLFQLSSKELGEEGFSGSAIFSVEKNAVVAIQTQATTSDVGAGRDTIVALPLFRIASHWNQIRTITQERIKIQLSQLIEFYLLPTFAVSMLNLQHSDNPEAYIRCIIVKYTKDGQNRFTVFEAKSNYSPLPGLVPTIRGRHPIRKKDYGVIGLMNKMHAPIFYDFVNLKCYQLSLSGSSESIPSPQRVGAKEKRIALLVAPIVYQGKTIGVLSFDFLEPADKSKNILNMIENDQSILSKLLFYSNLYSNLVTKLLTSQIDVDVDFLDYDRTE